jgi:hemoglobin-like flavoprotein
MGNTASDSTKQANQVSDIKSVVIAMMPLYYHEEEPTLQHIQDAKRNWDLIVDGTATGLDGLKGTHGFDIGSFDGSEGKTIFAKEFMNRFFDLEPTARPMFSDSTVGNPTWVISLVELCLTRWDDVKLFRGKMVELAKTHIRKGVCAIQYGVIGEILFWTLQKCTAEQFSIEAECAWKVLFSSMLRIIVPIAVHHEINHSTAPHRDIQLSKSQTAVNNALHMSISPDFEKNVVDGQDGPTVELSIER